ncbi:MAG: DEAD/DEAH box helicase family protein [Streptosporangiaceae bacterium]|nr:DEAD/DEAH box helicase family protein [Streptosporangiaceae bacterium]
MSAEIPGSQCCEHSAEIAELRKEIAALRARLDKLTSASEDTVASQPLHATVQQRPAVRAPQQMALPRPVYGAPLPPVDQGSTLQEKLSLYRTLFAGRSDVYAYRWENVAEGTKGWAPKRRPGTTRENPEYLPFTDDVISAHLTKDNPAAYGLYVMLADSTCRLLVCDFDRGTWRLDATAYAEAAAWAGVPAAIEISRSGEGAHVWTFFDEPVAAVDARAMGAALLHEAMAIRGEMGMDSYDRFFPAQDYLPRRGFGNLIALPLEGISRKNGTTLFVDPETFRPFEDQFAFLSSIERMTRRDVVERAEELQPPTVGPAVRLHRSPLAEEPPPPQTIKAELGGMLAIRRAGLPPSLLSSLKHLASLHNPEFYSRQQIGLSVWGAPRMLRCYEESLDRLFLPRGVADRAARLIDKAGSHLEITDLRSTPAELDIAFAGTLRPEQKAAVDAVSAHELGVLVAPPGAGKTVMGCGVIARHRMPTLILVDRTPLVDQWKERLREHLGLGPKDIGQLGGGKKTKLTGRVDLATLQALARADDPAEILAEYGLVIVDECHHVAAKTFAEAIRSIPAQRWLGLTATPRRPDRREEIMFMHCGPVRHKIPSETDLIQELHVHPTRTTIREDIDSNTPGILQSIIIPALVSDQVRTRQIVDDVVNAIRRSRNCLVMAARTEHVDLLATEITTRGLTPTVLHGSVPAGQRRAILKQLADWDPAHASEPLLLTATASYIGEGFDCPALDTLFLCSPSSSETIITQNVGRIMRELPGKTTVEVHDYADTQVPMLTRMHGKRLTTYKRIGFTSPTISDIPLFPDSEIARPNPPLPTASAESRRAGRTVTVPASQIRAWAKKHGIDVADRGRLRPEIWEQYQTAHPDVTG